MHFLTLFGPFSYTTKEFIEFHKAKTCIPVVEGHGKCNTETKLNECAFNDYEGYIGHSCQNEAYSLNSTGLKMPWKKIDADNNLSEIDLFMTIDNTGKVVEWQVESYLLTIVYNKSPKKTTFIINFQVNIDEMPAFTSTPTDKPSESCNCEDADNNASYFIPFIITSVSCIVMFIIVIILAVQKFKHRKKDNLKSDFLSDKNYKNPLI